MNWENLKKDLCPECGKKLHIRRGIKRGGYRNFESRLMTCQKTGEIKCGFAMTVEKYEKLKRQYGFNSEIALMQESSSLLDFYVKKTKAGL